MSPSAKLVVDGITAAGISTLMLLILQWQCGDPVAYLLFSLLAMVGSTRKFRLPGITGAYSLGFCFVLIAMFNFSVAETALLGALSGCVQCLYRPAQRPSVRSVLFSVSGVVLSATAAAACYLATVAAMPGSTQVAALVGASLYWGMNTGLVTVALMLSGEGTLKAIWERWFVWTLPYYTIGAAMAIATGGTVRGGHWLVALLLLPPLMIVYACGRLWLRVRIEG
jgi:hypothetical protein